MPLEHGDGRGERGRLARKRRGDPGAARTLHELSAAADRRERVAVREGLAERREIGRHIGRVQVRIEGGREG